MISVSYLILLNMVHFDLHTFALLRQYRVIQVFNLS